MGDRRRERMTSFAFFLGVLILLRGGRSSLFSLSYIATSSCNAPTGVKGQTLAKGDSTTREVDGELWRARDHKGLLVLRWTSKLGRCLTRQSKRSCSEAMTEKAISDKPSTGLRTRGSTKEQRVEMEEVNGVL